MLNELSPWHLIIILLIFALLFGSRRLPDAARGLGRSLRIFRAEMQSARDENTEEPNTTEPRQENTSAPFPTVAPVRDAVPPQAAPVDAVPPGVTTVPAAEPAKPAVD